jgi:hypothetical protein
LRYSASTNATLAACGVPPHDVSPIVIGIPASFGSLAILLFLLRIFDRVVLMKLTLGWDDYLLSIGVVRNLAIFAIDWSPWELMSLISLLV